jgi:hypothetical protein
MENEKGKIIFRGKVNQFENELLANIEGEIARIAVAPFISTFNEELKEERNRVERLYGEAMSDVSIHLLRLLTSFGWSL